MRRAEFATICAVAFLLVLSARVAAEEDNGRGVGYVTTGPVFDLPVGVSVERQEVYVSIYSVRLTYVFKSSRRQTARFSFVLPEMPVDAGPDAIGVAEGDEAAGFAADAQPVNYLDLSIRVNGQLLALAGRGRALLDGRDVTRQLLDAGVPLLYYLDGEAPWLRLSPDVRTMLEANGLLGLDTALWNYQASFGWDQAFQPGETRVEIRYAPVFRYWSDLNLDDFPELATDGPATRAYCVDDAVRRAFFGKRLPYELYTVTHRLTPPSGWHGSVAHYRLVVDKGVMTNLVAFCPSDARKISPTTFEWTASNYTPDSETGVLFFSDPDAAAAGEQEPS